MSATAPLAESQSLTARMGTTEEGEDVDSQEWVPPQEPEPATSSPPASPSQFAPHGRPTVTSRFRSKTPASLRVHIPKRVSALSTIRDRYSKTITSTIDRSDTTKFLEQFRYTIIASQLLSGHTILGARQNVRPLSLEPSVSSGQGADDTNAEHASVATVGGTVAVVFGAFAAALFLRWVAGRTTSGPASAALTARRVAGVATMIALVVAISHAYLRRQRLRCLHERNLTEAAAFVAASQDFDSATGAAVSLVQEVELVSRGYRIGGPGTPLPPISRLEDRDKGLQQVRRCVRLRRALKTSFAQIMGAYGGTTAVMQGFSEQLDLERYYDMYDVSDFDIADALQGFSEEQFDDAESLRTLKILAARFHTMRKIFLCALLALDVRDGTDEDRLRWTTVAEGLQGLTAVTRECYERVRSILVEEQCKSTNASPQVACLSNNCLPAFPNPPTPKGPLSPNRERWKSQVRKLNSLSSGIRGLQAKMHLMREESDRALNEADDISELGSTLMAQYESIGQDLQMLMQAWEEGKSALASGIDRNEKRLSMMSTLASPTTSLSGLTTVDDSATGGTVLDALKALNGGSPSSVGFHGSDDAEAEAAEEVYEAVALPRPRSMLTREERIIKMREERERKELAREKAEATRGMLRELEMVINLRPKTHMRPGTSNGRIVSM